MHEMWVFIWTMRLGRVVVIDLRYYRCLCLH